jgi:hypothetical protein
MIPLKASELRIGNYAFRNGILVQVDGRSIMDAEAGLVVYDGVPLTEDWLLKFGFQQVGNESKYFVAFQGRYHFVSLSSSRYNYQMGYEKDWLVQIPISPVHQLQNLYHALTGQELELK